MLYQALRETVKSKGQLIPYGADLHQYMKSNKDYYVSLYQYTEEQKRHFDESGSVAGIRNTTTDKLYFDFDSKEDLNRAKTDAISLALELVNTYGIPDEAVQAYFSGSKGFALEVKLNDRITPEHVRHIIHLLSKDRPTLDTQIVDPNRIIRVVNTVHPSSGLYKIALQLWELDELTVAQIQEKAKEPRLDVIPTLTSVPLPKALNYVPKSEKKPAALSGDSDVLDFSKKPKFLTNCRWALQNGYFSEGSRSTAFLCLASTYKNLGFDLEHVYRMLKGTAELQAQRNSADRFPDEELYNNIVTQVFSPNWHGGQYSCREEGSWLHGYCQGLGSNACKHKEEMEVSSLTAFSSKFKNFAANIEQNTIKFGIKAIDDRVMITTSMLVGLLGAPSAGKTQTVYEILNKTSNQGLDSMFFSMDMGLPLVYTRLIQKHFAYNRDKVYSIYKTEPQAEAKTDQTLQDQYKNVNFCFKSGLTVPQIKDIVVDYEKNTGKKLKLIVIDYLECLSSQFADATASTALIAQQLKDLANETNTCVLVLLQTQKASGDPSEPLLSMRKIKGASSIEQACSVIFTISRPGFSAKNPQDDKFITISTVKDRMGSLMSVDCGFEGLTGKITYPLSDEDYELLKEVRERKRMEKEMEGGGDGWG